MISAVIISYNEAGNIKRLMKSLEGLDDVVMCDDGSTDGTQALAESLGARVYRRHDHSVLVEDSDVEKFLEVYGYLPKFKKGDRMFNGSANRNEAASYAKNDWILNVDCDEIVTWDLPVIKGLLPEADIVVCKIVDNATEEFYDTWKLYNRATTSFDGRIHELPNGRGKRLVHTDKMSIRHYQKQKAYRDTYLPVIEYAAIKDNDLRMKFYLGKEYARANELDKSIRAFQEYLKEGSWLPEVMEAYTYLSKCLWMTGKKEEAIYTCMQAIVINPDYRESLLQMGLMLPEHAHVWKRYAKYAKNSDALIVRFG
jgi:glycosyltransferase involved in cell wall biosynthesis